MHMVRTERHDGACYVAGGGSGGIGVGDSAVPTRRDVQGGRGGEGDAEKLTGTNACCHVAVCSKRCSSTDYWALIQLARATARGALAAIASAATAHVGIDAGAAVLIFFSGPCRCPLTALLADPRWLLHAYIHPADTLQFLQPSQTATDGVTSAHRADR